MIRFRIGSIVSSFALAAALLAGAAATARAQIVTLFDVRESVISPDADGRVDSTRVRYSLNENATTLSLIVFESDGVTPVRTLRPPGAEVAGGPRIFYWNGRRGDGSVAAEGQYIVKLYARGASNPDSVKTLPVFVDVTRPTVQIVSALPNPYAPGAPGSTEAVRFSFMITNASPVSPGRVADELRAAFANPSGAAMVPDSLSTTPAYTGLDGAYVLAWHGTFEDAVPPDGEYRITLTLADVAGYASPSEYHFDVDTRPPDVKVTSMVENASVSVVPDSLRGYAFDKRGVDSLMVRYATSRPYRPVATTSLSADTLLFSIPLADSFPSEGAHRVDFRAVDIFGRVTSHSFNFRSDDTPPLAPVLDPFVGVGGRWNTSRYPLTGHANDGDDANPFVRVYRNGALVDSVSTFVSDDFEIDVPLVPGRNDLVAVLRDAAFNASPPSNTITVQFDTGAGVFAPAPFGPGDEFDVNVNRTAARCSLRLFDLLGQVVRVFEDESEQQFYSFTWNGQNGSNAVVRKGPLVVVAAVEYSDGSREIYREVVLYDPDAP